MVAASAATVAYGMSGAHERGAGVSIFASCPRKSRFCSCAVIREEISGERVLTSGVIDPGSWDGKVGARESTTHQH